MANDTVTMPAPPHRQTLTLRDICSALVESGEIAQREALRLAEPVWASWDGDKSPCRHEAPRVRCDRLVAWKTRRRGIAGAGHL